MDLHSPEGLLALQHARELLSAHVYEETRGSDRKQLMSATLESVVTDLMDRLTPDEHGLQQIGTILHAQSFLSMVLVHLVADSRIPPGADLATVMNLLFEAVDRWIATGDIDP